MTGLPPGASPPTIESINREFPEVDAFMVDSGMHYARHAGITVIAAAPDPMGLREQVREYFDNRSRDGYRQPANGCSV